MGAAKRKKEEKKEKTGIHTGKKILGQHQNNGLDHGNVMRFREGFNKLFDFKGGVFALVVESIAKGALDEGGIRRRRGLVLICDGRWGVVNGVAAVVFDVVMAVVVVVDAWGWKRRVTRIPDGWMCYQYGMMDFLEGAEGAVI